MEGELVTQSCSVRKSDWRQFLILIFEYKVCSYEVKKLLQNITTTKNFDLNCVCLLILILGLLDSILYKNIEANILKGLFRIDYSLKFPSSPSNKQKISFSPCHSLYNIHVLYFVLLFSVVDFSFFRIALRGFFIYVLRMKHLLSSTPLKNVDCSWLLLERVSLNSHNFYLIWFFLGVHAELIQFNLSG